MNLITPTSMKDKLSDLHQKSKKHTDYYRKYFALNRNTAGFSKHIKELTYTLVADRSEGPYIFDIDDNRYIDLTMGFGSILLGHNAPEIRQAIEQQLQKNWSVGPISPLAGQLAEAIALATKTERVAFFNSGTEAIMVALRIAKATSKKNNIAFFKGSYHGTFDSLLSLKKDYKTQQARAIIPGVTQSILNESYLLDYSSPKALEFIEAHADDLAAVLVEPVQSRNPSLQPQDFLQELRAICSKNHIALIFDEVITGFRIGIGGAQAYFGVEADVVTYGKVIGGGLPIGVVAGKAEYMDLLDGGHWQFGDDSVPQSRTTFVAGTFCHHPLTMASALKILEILQANDAQILKELNAKTTAFCQELNTFFEAENFPIKIVHFASLFRFELDRKYNMLYHQLLLEGVYIWEGRNCFLSPAHSLEVLEDLKKAIKRSCWAIRAEL